MGHVFNLLNLQLCNGCVGHMFKIWTLESNLMLYWAMGLRSYVAP